MNHLPKKLFADMRLDLAKELGITTGFDTSASVLVVTGKNAVGKSLLRRYLQMTLCQDHNFEVMHLSQQDRADSDGIMRVMVYGSEREESTGTMTAKTFIAGMRTMRGRDKAHAIIWDEPEIGMGEELQIGTANWLCEQLADWPTHLQGVILLTHSKHFVRRVMEFPGAKWLSMDGVETAQKWLNRKLVAVGPEEVMKLANEKRRHVGEMLRRKR